VVGPTSRREGCHRWLHWLDRQGGGKVVTGGWTDKQEGRLSQVVALVGSTSRREGCHRWLDRQAGGKVVTGGSTDKQEGRLSQVVRPTSRREGCCGKVGAASEFERHYCVNILKININNYFQG